MKLSKATPSGAATVVSAVVLRKALHLTGIATKTEALECIEAAAMLASTGLIGGAVGLPTGGFGALAFSSALALQVYDVKNSCFNKDGFVFHAVKVP